MNPNQEVRIEKVTLNFGAGKEKVKLERGMKILEVIGGKKPVQTYAKKRIPTWGLRPGLPIGCKATFRKTAGSVLLKRLLAAKSFVLGEKNFDERGNVSFGVPEYIDVEGAKYDPEIGVIGFQVNVTLEKSGYRVKKRVYNKTSVGKNHVVKKDEAMAFMQKAFNVKVGDEA